MSRDCVFLCPPKKRRADRAWLLHAPPMIESALECMRRCSEEAEISPEMLRAVAGAFKVVSEAIASREIIDARIRKALGESGLVTGQLAPNHRHTHRTG